MKKLPISIAGDTRNTVIDAFRKWRGAQYIPQNVHASIRWSKHSPWYEVISLDERLGMLEKQRQKKKLEKKELRDNEGNSIVTKP